jgi:Protein of unknown function (DUF2865)
VQSLRSRSSGRCAGTLVGVVAALIVVAAPPPARAGFFDFLFSGRQDRPSGGINSYAEPPASLRPTPPLGGDTARANGGGGRAVAFCVRLCDGQHFPLEHFSNATPVETCRAMCPASKTKVFFGGEIDHAVARDGARYADLDGAFVYRAHLVPNCTCNGKDAFGLAPFDLSSDPTLRAGDIVATKEGFLAYTGKRAGKKAAFTPVDAKTVSAQLNSGAAHARLARRNKEPEVADEEPGIIVPQGGVQAAR